MNIELPKDWKSEKLDDALEYVIGGDWGKDENFEDPNYGSAYCIRGSEIKNWEEDKGRTASLRKIKLSNIEKRKLIEGDILVEISGGGPEQPVGRTVLIDKTVLSYIPDIPKICTNFLRLMRPKDYIDSKFLNFYLKLFYYSGEVVKYQGGSNNLRNLKFPDYVKINFPLPPKHTQLAIVSKIEELFSELEKGIESLFTAKQQLKTYRQSVLKWAFEGKLTEENVKEGELPKGWKWVKIDYLLSHPKKGMATGPFGTMLKKSEHQKSGVPVLGIENIGEGVFQMPNKIFVSNEKAIELKNFRVKENDIIISRSGTVGEICLLPKKMENSIISTNLIRVSLNLEITNPKYFVYLFQGGKVRQQVFDLCKGSSRAFLNQTILNSLDFPYCSIEEQHKVVQEIESRLSVADKMEESIIQSLQQAEALKQSILKKAFEGKLI